MASSVCWGFHYLQKYSKILLCLFLEGNQDPVPRLHCCLLAAPHLSPDSPPFLSNNCFNLHFETQERFWRLKPVSYKQETGQRGFHAQEPDGSCLVSVTRCAIHKLGNQERQWCKTVWVQKPVNQLSLWHKSQSKGRRRWAMFWLSSEAGLKE